MKKCLADLNLKYVFEIALVLFIILAGNLEAGVSDNIQYNIALFDEGTMIPFYSGFASIPIHPGLLVGQGDRIKIG